MTSSTPPEGFTWRSVGEYFYSVRELPAWKGYQCINSDPALTGSTVELRIRTAEGALIDEITSKHVYATQWLIENQEELHDTLIEALFFKYPEMLAEFREWGNDDPSLNVKTLLDFKNLIDLRYVDIFPFQKNSLPYLGFELECEWD
ncbi:MAG: DUF6985 domain-containing protein, partial [Burkholderiaceae bacterium]